jgi:hypothetical protein
MSRESRSERALLALAAAAIVLGFALRLAAARGDLWLDELWSLQLANATSSPLDVFWKIHHDNNNYLNTLWLIAVGDGAAPLLYRALSVVSGLGMVALGAGAVLGGGRFEGAAAAILLAVSRFLVHYGSEARGYGLAMFFALAAFVSLDRYLRTGRRRFAAAFSVTAALGVLSHLTFVFVLAAALAWAAFEIARRRRAGMAERVLLGIPPLLLVVLWFVDIRFAEVGGAPSSELWNAVRELIRTTFGLPRGPLELVAVAFLGAAAFELVALIRERDSRAVFFVALYLAPVASLLVWKPDYPSPRHFGVLAPFTLLLVAGGLARLARVSRWGVAAGALALGVFCAGNALQVAILLHDGRGHYRDAVALILERSAGHVATVGSFNDFRNRPILDDQVRRLGAGARLEYLDRASRATRTPEWLLYNDWAERPPDVPYMEIGGRTYALTGIFPYAGLSGWSWLLYRLTEPPAK